MSNPIQPTNVNSKMTTDSLEEDEVVNNTQHIGNQNLNNQQPMVQMSAEQFQLLVGEMSDLRRRVDVLDRDNHDLQQRAENSANVARNSIALAQNQRLTMGIIGGASSGGVVGAIIGGVIGNIPGAIIGGAIGSGVGTVGGALTAEVINHHVINPRLPQEHVPSLRDRWNACSENDALYLNNNNPVEGENDHTEKDVDIDSLNDRGSDII